jgi:hypothetical protein
MNLAILGSFGKRPLGPGWRKETAVAFPRGELAAVAVLGGVEVKERPVAVPS